MWKGRCYWGAGWYADFFELLDISVLNSLFMCVCPQVMPESFWLEADWSHDVRIANNYIEGPYGGILVGLMMLNEMGSGLYLNHRSATGARQTGPCTRTLEQCTPAVLLTLGRMQ